MLVSSAVRSMYIFISITGLLAAENLWTDKYVQHIDVVFTLSTLVDQKNSQSFSRAYFQLLSGNGTYDTDNASKSDVNSTPFLSDELLQRRPVSRCHAQPTTYRPSRRESRRFPRSVNVWVSRGHQSGNIWHGLLLGCWATLLEFEPENLHHSRSVRKLHH